MRVRSTLCCLGVVGALVFASTATATDSGADDPQPPATTNSGWLADAQSAESEGYALQLAQTWNHQVLVRSRTTETQVVYAQPDGTLHMASNAQPVRIETPDGDWAPVDTTLQPAADGAVEPAMSAVPMRFSGGGDSVLARIQAKSGDWLSLNWDAGSLPTPRLDDSAVIYPDVYPDVDLRVAATATGFSEVLVVKSATAAANPALQHVRFGVADGQLTSTEDGNGGLVSKSADGTVQLRQGAPTWWDSRGSGADETGPSDNSIPRPLPTADADSTSVSLNAAEVAVSPGVVYPVFVDPSFSGARKNYTYVDKAYPTESYFNGSGASDDYVHVGYVDGPNSDDGRAHTGRGFYAMYANGVEGAHILSAQFNVNLRYSFSCTATAVNLYITHLNAGIGHSTTWNDQPTLGTLQDTKSGAWRNNQCENGGSGGNMMGFDATNGVTYTAAKGMGMAYFALKASSESSNLSWKKFGPNPTLDVTYNHVPSQAAGLSVTPCYQVCSGNVISRPTATAPLTITGRATDADPGNLYMRFYLYQGSSTTPFYSYQYPGQPQNTLVHFAVPSSVLKGDGQYQYRVYAWDGTDSGAWSAFQQFKIDSTAPPAPGAALSGATTTPNTPNTDVEGVVGAAITMSFAVAANADMTEIVYSTIADLPTMSTPPPCNTSLGNGVFVVCKSGSTWPAQTIAAQDTSDSVSLVAFDAAGNRSSTANIPFRVKPNIAAVQAGHSWPVVPEQLGAVPDTAASGQLLSETSTVQRVVASPNSGVTSIDPDTGEVTVAQVTTQAFNPSLTPRSQAATTSGVLNTAASFTVAAWVRADSGGANRVALSQAGSAVSAFQLRLSSANTFQMCMPSVDSTSAVFTCASATTAAATDGTAWYFVVGQWDAINKQVRLSINNGGLYASYRTANVASNGPLTVGYGQTPVAMPWSGAIYNPVVLQGIATPVELTRLSDYTTPSSVDE